jgi:hypothetical protein
MSPIKMIRRYEITAIILNVFSCFTFLGRKSY